MAEFVDNLTQSMMKIIYQGLYDYCEYIFDFFLFVLNNTLNKQIETATGN